MFHRTKRNSICLKHKSIWYVPYAVLVGKMGFHNQTSVVQLQKYIKTFFLVFFVSPQIDRNVLALTHLFKDVPHVEQTLQHVRVHVNREVEIWLRVRVRQRLITRYCARIFTRSHIWHLSLRVAVHVFSHVSFVEISCLSVYGCVYVIRKSYVKHDVTMNQTT